MKDLYSYYKGKNPGTIPQGWKEDNFHSPVLLCGTAFSKWELEDSDWEITWAPTLLANIVADFLCSSVSPTYSMWSNRFWNIFKTTGNLMDRVIKQARLYNKGICINHINWRIGWIPWPLQEHNDPARDASSHNGALRGLHQTKSCLSVLPPKEEGQTRKEQFST